MVVRSLISVSSSVMLTTSSRRSRIAASSLVGIHYLREYGCLLLCLSPQVLGARVLSVLCQKNEWCSVGSFDTE